MRTAVAFLALATIGCVGYAIDLLAQGQFVLAAAPLFIGGALFVGTIAFAKRAYGFLLGWAYPAALAAGWFGTTTAFEIVHEFQKLGTLDTTPSCLDVLVPLIGDPILWFACLLGGIIGISVARTNRNVRASLKANAYAVTAAVALTAICSALAWSPWIRGGGCF